MTTPPTVLQISGGHFSLIVTAEDDAEVSFYLQGMRVHFSRKALADGSASYELPEMGAAGVKEIAGLLMREGRWNKLSIAPGTGC